MNSLRLLQMQRCVKSLWYVSMYIYYPSSPEGWYLNLSKSLASSPKITLGHEEIGYITFGCGHSLRNTDSLMDFPSSDIKTTLLSFIARVDNSDISSDYNRHQYIVLFSYLNAYILLLL